MRIKITIAPDDKAIGDIGTEYIESESLPFIEALMSIQDARVMVSFLDENKKHYTDNAKPFENVDITLDLTKSFMELFNNKSIKFKDKLFRNGNSVETPKVK